MSNELPENIIRALRAANTELQRSSKAISEAYEAAEHSGDYSDADELAADHREHLDDQFSYLLDAFIDQYPDLFTER